MTAKKARKTGPWLVVIGNRPAIEERTTWLGSQLADPRQGLVPPFTAILYIVESISHQGWSVQHALPWEGLPTKEQPARLILIWDCLPVDAAVLMSWKDFLLTATGLEHSSLICPPSVAGLNAFQMWIRQCLRRSPEIAPAQDEDVRLRLGEYVTIPADARNSLVHAAFVTLSFGAMRDTVERLGYWRLRYLEQIGHLTDLKRETFHKSLAPVLQRAEDSDDRDWEKQQQKLGVLEKRMEEMGISESRINPSALPVLLLTGETGTGKTLIATYLARLSADVRLPFFRVPVPEYEASENLFEHEVFGFRGGSYSDAPPSGDPGILLSHVGGVVFLDEIGDASPATQRKLLAYLDDYQVRPRGLHRSIYCPAMVVAATNCELTGEVDAKRFRRDLYMRFDVQIHVPSLNDRKPDFDFILDTVLQNPGINPGRRVTEIGADAYEALSGLDYTDGNFRRLENVFRSAIREATRQGRAILVKKDLQHHVWGHEPAA